MYTYKELKESKMKDMFFFTTMDTAVSKKEVCRL